MGENNILGVIETIEDDNYQGKEFKKVTLMDGQVLKVKYGREGLLKAKWGELQAGTAFKFTMGTYQNHPFVQDFQAIEGELPEPAKAPLVDSANPPKGELPTPAPQAVGMITKEIGDMIRKSLEVHKEPFTLLTSIYGKETAIELVTWYRSQMLGITRITYKNLPNFKSDT